MPIDWEAVVAPFRNAFHGQVKSFVETVLKIARWLEKRVEGARKTELVSRAFPIIDFTEGAVQMSVALFQQRSLALPAVTAGPRPTDEYLSTWQRIKAGFQRIPDAVEEALAIPRLVGTIEDMLGTIVASIERWEKPDWRMLFDPKQHRSFSDVFGQIFYFANMLSLSVDPIRVILTSDFLKYLMKPSAKSEEPGITLEDLIQYMAGALLLLPLGFEWFGAALRWGLISLKVRVLDFLIGMEDMLYAIRRKAVEFVMKNLVDMLRGAFYFIEGVKTQLLDVVSHILKFGVSVISEWGGAIHDYVRRLSEALLGINDIFDHILEGLKGIMKIDVIGLYTGGVVTGTVQELVDIVTKKDWMVYWSLRGDLLALRGAGDLLYIVTSLAHFFSFGKIPQSGLLWRWGKYGNEIVGVLGNLPDKKIPSVDLPAKPSDFPNIYEYFTTKNKVDMAGQLQTLRTEVQAKVPGILNDAGDALIKMGDEMDASAWRMANIGPLARATQIRDFADSTAEMLFGDQKKQLQDALHRDELAAAFDMAVAGGGFHIIGGAIALYVEAMREFWERQPEPGKDLPTSPHILAVRQRLGKVNVPAVTIRTSGRALDDPLISRVANEFRKAVQGAWGTGLQQLEAGT